MSCFLEGLVMMRCPNRHRLFRAEQEDRRWVLQMSCVSLCLSPDRGSFSWPDSNVTAEVVAGCQPVVARSCRARGRGGHQLFADKAGFN